MALLLTAEVLDPVSAGAAREVSFVRRAHRYVPGSVLRGALAAAYLRISRGPTVTDADFRRLFEGAVRFGPLLPEGTSFQPLSHATCKYPRAEGCAEFSLDLAFFSAVKPVPTECPCCHGVLELSKGDLVDAGGQGIPRSTRSSVALHKGVAEQGKLYEREVIASGTQLRGAITGPEKDLERLQEHLPSRLRLGGRRTVGGRVRLAAQPGNLPRVAVPDGDPLVLTLCSPGIFVDAAGRPRLSPHEADVSAVLGVGVVAVRSWSRPQSVGGFHAASGLPKPVELTASPGSTYAYLPDGDLPADATARLADAGLGLRRNEGFGWVNIRSKPYHPADVSSSAGEPTDAVAVTRATLQGLTAGQRRAARREIRDLLREVLALPADRRAGRLPELLDRPGARVLNGVVPDGLFDDLSSTADGRLRALMLGMDNDLALDGQP